MLRRMNKLQEICVRATGSIFVRTFFLGVCDWLDSTHVALSFHVWMNMENYANSLYWCCTHINIHIDFIVQRICLGSATKLIELISSVIVSIPFDCSICHAEIIQKPMHPVKKQRILNFDLFSLWRILMQFNISIIPIIWTIISYLSRSKCAFTFVKSCAAIFILYFCHHFQNGEESYLIVWPHSDSISSKSLCNLVNLLWSSRSNGIQL